MTTESDTATIDPEMVWQVQFDSDAPPTETCHTVAAADNEQAGIERAREAADNAPEAVESVERLPGLDPDRQRSINASDVTPAEIFGVDFEAATADLRALKGATTVTLTCVAGAKTSQCSGWTETVDLDAPVTVESGDISLPGFDWACPTCHQQYAFLVNDEWLATALPDVERSA